jgi:tetratricopeptide (TPR) repeat protein
MKYIPVKRLSWVIAVAVIIIALVFACRPALLDAATGETGASFLNLGVGANALAMGGAVTSIAQGATALYWNPGALGWLTGSEFAVMHAEHFQSIRHEHIAYSHGSRAFSFGFSLKALYLGGLEERTGPSEDPIGTFGAYYLAPAVTCAKALGGNVSSGLTIKTVYQAISDYSSMSIAGDIGLAAKLGQKGPRWGISLDNIGMSAAFDTASFSLPTKLKTGFSLTTPGDRLVIAFDLIKPFADDLAWCTGMQAMVNKSFQIRAGYRSDVRDNGGLAGLSSGIGLKINDIGVDYAVTSYGFLGVTHSISIAYSFDRSQAKIDQQEALIAEELRKRMWVTAETFYRQGLAQQRAGNYEEALGSFDIALIWNPQYSDALRSIGELRKTIDSENVNARLTQGISEFNKGSYIEALRSFSAALSIDSANVLTKQWIQTTSDALVKLQLEKGQLDQATRKKIADYMEKGIKYFTLKQFTVAINEWKKVLAIDAQHREALDYISKAQDIISRQVAEAFNTADQCMDQGKWAQALIEINKVLAWEPSNQAAAAKKVRIREQLRALSIGHTKKGIEFFKQKKFAQAEAEFKVAMDYDSLNVTASNYLKKLSSTAGTVKSADINDLYMKGITAYTQEDFRAAIRYWKKILEIDPQNSNAQRNIARAEEKLKLGSK